MTIELQGILPAVVTPFTDDFRFAGGAYERLLERLYAAGAQGLYVCGQTGEGLQQTVAMRREVAEAAVRCSPPGKAVVVHVGAARTADAVELARHAGRAGAHAVSSLPPAGAYSFGEVKTYYERVAAAAEAPVLVYFFPDHSRAVTTFDQIAELCAIPGVVGLKFTDFDLFTLSRLARAGHLVFNGRDEVLAAGLLMGACGGIGSFYNLVPQWFVDVYEHTCAGRWTEARAMQDRINDLIAVTLQFPVFPAIKTMLRWSGIDCGGCMEPRRGLTGSEEQRLRAELSALGIDAAGFLR
jgi:N-acetylneuraminate lyase